jgi:hypothetical protein
MIDIAKLIKEDIGKWVVYKPELENEKGKIKSFNLETGWIFVVYKCAGEWHRFQDFTGQATKPEDLYWLRDLEQVIRANTHEVIYEKK